MRIESLRVSSTSSSPNSNLAFRVTDETQTAENFGVSPLLHDYIVVKINCFSCTPFDTVNNAWNLAMEHAEVKGHNKLLLDLGRNNGASLFAGYTPTTCMFPLCQIRNDSPDLQLCVNDAIK